MSVTLTSEQKTAVENTGGQILVSAAAGSGKTRVLVERLLRLVRQGLDVDSCLVITYTRAAAAELRGKILDALFDEIARDPANSRLRREAAILGRAQIGTIHGFCAGVIRENAHVLAIPPDFRVADEREAGVMKDQALTDLLEDLYDSAEEDFIALADTLGSGADDRTLRDVILETHVKLMSHPDPEDWARRQMKLLELEGVTDAAQTPWGRVIMGRARESAEYWAERMEYLIDECQGDAALEKGYGNSFRGTHASLMAFIDALGGTWDGARAASKIDFPRGFLKGHEEQKAVRQACKDAMAETAELFWDDSARALGDMRRVAPIVSALFRTVLLFDERYSQLKRRRGVLDFSDQEHMALKLLVDPETGGPTPVARETAGRFAEIMVDEYQDVNETQEAIIRAVSREGRNIFTVGDVKQSIYRFRLADPTIFLRKYLSFADAPEAGEGEPRRILLTRSFRSAAGILDCANFLFSNLMSRRLGDLDYTPREYLYQGGEDSPFKGPRVELDVIDVKDGFSLNAGGDDSDGDGNGDSGDDDDRLEDKNAAEALFAARRIREIVGHVSLPDGSGGMRPAAYSDIAVLMRSPRAFMDRWQQVFALEGIPLASGQPRAFFSEHEISLTLSLLSIIDNPRQDIPLISVLRSPIYGFTADELAGIRLCDREGDFWSALNRAAGEQERAAAFLRELDDYRRAAPDMTSDELLWYVYSGTRLFAVVSAMEDGQRRRENLMLLLEMARTCEGSGYKGLFGFLTYLRRLRDRGDVPEGYTLGNENAVTVMSIHKSKGLEFPIVILAGLSHGFNREDTKARILIHPELGAGPKLTDLERRIEYYTIARRAVSERLRREMLSEELRVLYVAVTRPREKLIMLTSFSDAQKHLTALMNTPLPAPTEVLAGCQSLADWVLIPALRRPEAGPIRFGVPNIPCDTIGAPWDIRLVSGVAPAAALAGARTAPESGGEVQVPKDLRARLDYVYPHPDAVGMPSKITATELKGTYVTTEAADEAGAAIPEDIPGPPAAPAPEPAPEEPERPTYRPAFMEDGARGLTPAQRGTALHIVMQFADYEKCLTAQGAAEETGRLLEKGIITREQADAVRPELISRFFASEPGRLILNAEKLYRELKFSILADSGDIPGLAPGERILLQGVVDCCVEREGRLTVIDFKTDRVTKETLAERTAYYSAQLDTYAMALRRILKKPVERRLICFLTAGVYADV